MCSVSVTGDIEDLSNSVPISKLKIKRLPDKCNKCKEHKPHILLRNKDAYCKDCFLASTNHKFRAILGKHRLIKDNDRVLIHYTGGHSSTSLLNFLKTGLELDTPKKVRYVPICLFVENQFNLPRDERKTKLNDIAEEVKKFNIPLFYSSLIDFYESEGENVCIYETLEDFPSKIYDTKKESFFKTSQTLSNDLEKIYGRKLLISAAKKLNCKFIFTPELSTDIASQILSDVALGRGSHIPSSTGVCDTRDSEVTIIRPLRVFDIKELALYNYFHSLDPIILNVKPAQNSIQTLIENFVEELQSNYPATVTTILKTGEKLSMVNNKKKTAEICYICQSPIDVPFQTLTSSKAIKFSCDISQPKKQNSVQREEDESNKKTCFSCSKIEEFLL
ncbi:cytoplasmic tRNA 2-thiolation protein 2-A [Coccinella septempunctata]|uniref:cytoplasmic tRNA 2-thiolation protein 2-A n=1 Tax=Coccinella septempunctata TaxID=41139 RepID=UPI001D087522|nr:cytoplasmic tRNA 2-thiolation protein 2-A [Coccinella septempunctata]